MRFALRVVCYGVALAVMASDTYAGCGLFHRGGCSDTCFSPSYGASVATCQGCGSASYVVPNGHIHSASGYSVSSAGDGCSGCAAQALSAPVMYSGGISSTGYAPSTQILDDGCSTCGGQLSVAGGVGPAMAASVASAPSQENVDCGPVTTYRVVMEPKYITETRAVPSTETRQETRYRTRTVSRQVPVEVQDYRTTTIMVPKTETKTVEYTVLVPQKSEKTVEVVESVPVWNDIEESYTVRVPTVVDVPEEYTVRVPSLRDEEFTYTVYIPQAQTQTKTHTYTNAVPVTKTRTVQVCRPVTRMQTVTKDYGHWEIRVEEVAAAAAPVVYSAPSYAAPAAGYGINMGGCGTAASYGVSSSCGACGGCGQVYTTRAAGCRRARSCGRCGGCGSVPSAPACGGCGSGVCGGGCGTNGIAYSTMGYGVTDMGIASADAVYAAPATQTVSRRVWVPNVVTEEVPVVESVNETQEVSYTAFEQQTQSVPYECTYLVYVPEERTGTRKVVDYVNETRTRTRKVVQYNDETRTRTRRELTYTQQTRTETVPFVTYTTEKRTKEVNYTINVPETRVEPITTTRFDTVQEETTEEYTVSVPVCTMKEVQVQVCRMVPKLVPTTIYPCTSDTASATYSAPGYQMEGYPMSAPAYGTPSVAPVFNGVGSCSNCGAANCSTCN